MNNYIRLFELIFNRMYNAVESQTLLAELEIPPADPGTFLAAYLEGKKPRWWPGLSGGGGGGHLNQLLLLRVSIVLKADFIAIRTNAAFLS